MKTSRFLAPAGLCLLMTMPVLAQRGPGGGGPGGFRPGGGPGGGFPGGGFPGGGPPGGDRGSRGGGDRGSRGGFDPSGFLTRLDTNQNGILDPSEQQGPAQFMISRLQQVDPSIKAGQPISIKKATEAFTKAREQRDAGNDPRASRGGSSGNSAADQALETELLVPGFGLDEEPIPLLGFGATAEMLAVVVTEADQREAAERMRRYDRNRDGFLTKDELSSRFAGNPMDFDRNKDGKLSEKELAVRYARRREGEEAEREQKREDDRRSRDRRGSSEPVDVYGGRKSYRNLEGRKLPSGLPGFFNDKDTNGDGQVTMAEYSNEWNDELIKEYFQFDLNSDGAITAAEAAEGVESGASASVASNTTASPTRSDDSPKTSSGGGSTTTSAPAPVATGSIDSRNVKYAERIISRYDKNKDGALTASEYENMLINPKPADSNRDGRITINEYAMWMQSRSKK